MRVSAAQREGGSNRESEKAAYIEMRKSAAKARKWRNGNQ